MAYKFLKGAGGSASVTRTKRLARITRVAQRRHESSALSGLLVLDAQEFTDFATWAEEAKPNETMVEAVKLHSKYQLKRS